MPVPGRRGPALLAAVWLVGALAATGTGVLAVRLVGEQVGDPATVPLTAEGVDAALASVAAVEASASPVATPGVAGSPGAPGSPAGEATGPAASGVVPVHPVPAPRRTTSAPAPAAPAPAPPRASSTTAAPQQEPSSPPAPSSDTRTFSNAGGTIGVRCEGSSPRLVYATPAQGYRLEDQESDTERVEVRFRSDEDEARLRAGCSGGQPVLLESEQGDDD